MGEQGSATWEFFDHAADVGIELRADSLESLFIAAGQALMEWVGPAPASGETASAEIRFDGDSVEELLVRWLQELLYLFHQRHQYFMNAPLIALTPTSIEASVTAVIWNEAQYQLYQEVKAVTYHRLRIQQEGSGWRATVILDI